MEIKQHHKSGQLIHNKAEGEEDRSKVQMGQLENKYQNSRLILIYVTLNINGLQFPLKPLPS